MKKVLVTGASGFIGRHSLELLSNRGFEVHAATLGPAQSTRADVVWHDVNLLDNYQASTLVSAVKPTHLLHFAWNVAHGKFWASTDNLKWLHASLHLLQEFIRNGGRRFVTAGTCGEYDWRFGLCDEKYTPMNPSSLYGATKYALYQLSEKLCEQAGITLACGRIFFLYGPGEDSNRFIPSLIHHLSRGEPLPCSHGRQIRDYLYVADVASAFVALVESRVRGAVNIASGVPRSLREVAQVVECQVGRSGLVRFGDLNTDPALDPAIIIAAVDRLGGEVGWRPSYTFEEGIRETITRFMSQV